MGSIQFTSIDLEANDDGDFERVVVGYTVATKVTATPIPARTVVTMSSHGRVRVETGLRGRDADTGNLLYVMLDPDEQDVTIEKLLAEIGQLSELLPLTIPVLSDDPENIAAVAHSYILSGRSSW